MPNVVVDGRANTATVLTLSHWPQAPCPADLRRDLSAQSALAYLSTPCPPRVPAELVTNNHFDQDGLMSVLPWWIRPAPPTGPSGGRGGSGRGLRGHPIGRRRSGVHGHRRLRRPRPLPLDASVFAGTYDQAAPFSTPSCCRRCRSGWTIP